MSAPLVVNTSDGACWVLRARTREGLALYALEGACGCPPFVMATEADLAEYGIVGSADVLPVPVGSTVSAASGDEASELRAALQDTLAALLAGQVERDKLTTRVAELEAERHSTNEALDDAVQALRARETARSADKLTRLLAPTQALREDEPETGGAR